MTERKIEFRTADGVVDGYFFPAASGSGPGVIHLTDIRGNRPANREKSAWLAAQGYSVLQPNVFYRTGKEPVFDFPFVFGEERSMKRFRDITVPLDGPAQERDAQAYVAELRKQPEVTAGPLGVVGHCFTGPMALRVAAAVPEQIGAAASFHGGGIVTQAETSPHRVLPRVKAQLYFAHASNDALMPADAIQTLEKALAAWGGKYENETYEGARHGWTVSDGPAYDAKAADRAHAKLLELFARTLR
jgi:carboxymethylenebutenolidase